MILKNQVEWALHCCSVLSALPPGKYISTKALAEFHGVPKEYLSKALQSLSQNELVESTLGPSGGYRLARKPSEISFLDIVEAVEGKASTFACSEIRMNGPCLPAKYRPGKSCAVARVMWKADEAWRKELRSVTLADLGETLLEDVPAKILSDGMDWLMNKN
jgi:Rrf2 family protein